MQEIRIQHEPADSPIQRKDYKLFPPEVLKGEADWDAGLTIDAMPVNSAICESKRGARLKAGALTLRGVGHRLRERAIKRVDVSLDGGHRCRQALLQQDATQPHAWTLWSLEAELAKGEHELVVRAFDSAMQTQPNRPDDTWN